ncbi:MAG: leucine-rich repeat domain-containing protein [Kofleriaceae bacterium]
MRWSVALALVACHATEPPSGLVEPSSGFVVEPRTTVPEEVIASAPDDNWPHRCPRAGVAITQRYCVRQHWGSMRAALELRELTSIACTHCRVGDVSALAAHPALVEFSLTNTQIDNVASLGALAQLRSLTLFDTDVRDLRAIAPLVQLVSLSVNGDIEDATAIRRFTRLTYLAVGSNRLRELDLSSNSELEFLSLRLPFARPPSLAKLSKLRTFIWQGRSLVDASELLVLPELRLVTIQHHCIPDDAVRELQRVLESRRVDVTIANRSPDCAP